MDITAATAEMSGHPFEVAGLGKAPFRFVGMAEQDLRYGEAILNRGEYERTGIAITTKPGGSCAYCGTYIGNMYNVRSADGRVFHVGSECVNKTGDAKLIGAIKVERRKADRVKRAAKTVANKSELATLLACPVAREALAAAPHPKPAAWRPASENTLLAYVEWMSVRAGAAGRATALKLAKAVCK